MNKSLRNRIFLRTLIALVLVVGANRLVSRWLSQAYVMETVEAGVALILAGCEGVTHQQSAFRHCARLVSEKSLFENLALEPTACPLLPEQGDGTRAEVCESVLRRATDLAWSQYVFTPAAGIQHTLIQVDGVPWLAFRRNAPTDGTLVLIRQNDLDEFLTRLWSLRDWVFIYVVPLSMLGLFGITWMMMRQVMKPLKDMQEGITRLSSSNLSEAVHAANPYREFAPLVTAFDDLRGRLHASFMQSQRFAADASHELRTPLTILRGHIEQVIDEAPAGSQAQIHLRVIEDEITRMANVTEKLLLLSRADAQAVRLTLDPLDFSEFMEQLVSDARAIQASLAISADIAPDITWYCDAQLVRQLVYNLLTNALNHNTTAGWVRFRLTAQAGWLELAVENPAHGFTAEHEARAFERCYRGNAARTRKVEGQGLGLSLCREIAHLHRGTMTLASWPDLPSGAQDGATAGWVVVCATLRVPLRPDVRS